MQLINQRMRVHMSSKKLTCTRKVETINKNNITRYLNVDKKFHDSFLLFYNSIIIIRGYYLAKFTYLYAKNQIV